MKKEITISKFTATIDGHNSETFDRLTDAVEQVKEWFKIDFNNEEGWSDTTQAELRSYVKPVVDGRTLSWEEFDKLDDVLHYDLQFNDDFDGYKVDGVRTYIVDESETYYVEIEIDEEDEFTIDGKWSLYLDAEYRHYVNLDTLSESDVADLIKKTFEVNSKYVRLVYAFDSTGNSIDCGTARGLFTANKK
jgi:hypothetical protein